MSLPLQAFEIAELPRRKRRVERKTWRVPVAVCIGAIVGLAALGIGGGVWSLLAGAAAGLAVVLSDGWSR